MTTRVPYAMTDAPLNVLAYGAKGDGTTDDTAAFQAALDAAAGKHLHVPAGAYRVTSGLTVSNRTRITGDGPTASQINYRPTVTTANQLFDFDNVDNIVLENLGMALETGGGGRTTTAVQCQGDGGSVTEILLRRVHITGFQQYGVRLNTGAYYVVLDGVRILNCSNSTTNGGTGTGNAVAISIGSPVNALRIRDCRFAGNDKVIDCNSTAKYSLVISGSYFEQNGRASSPAADDTINLYGWKAVEFTGNYCEGNLTGTATADSFLKLQSCAAVDIRGNLFACAYGGTSKTKNAIGITGSTGVVIEANEFQDPITKAIYVVDGNSLAKAHRNRYVVASVVQTTYAQVVALVTPSLVEIDVALLAAVSTGTIAAAGNYQTNVTMSGVDVSRTTSVVATPQGSGAADWIFSAAPIGSDLVRVMFYNIKGANNTFSGNVALRLVREG